MRTPGFKTRTAYVLAASFTSAGDPVAVGREDFETLLELYGKGWPPNSHRSRILLVSRIRSDFPLFPLRARGAPNGGSVRPEP